jgi:hypothetical protein
LTRAQLRSPLEKHGQVLERCVVRRRIAEVIAAVAVVALVLGAAAEETIEARLQRFLRTSVKLDEAQLAAVEKGEVVTKLLPMADASEIAAFGAVKTAGDPDLLLRLAKDVPKLRKVPQVVEMGMFGAPPTLADLAGLTWPPDDVAALHKCKPGSCDVKLGTKGLEILSQVDWSAADAQGRAVAILNQGIVDYAAAYEKGGMDALGDTLDKKTARSRAQEYRSLLAHSPYLVEYVKEFHDYLASYPQGALADAEDVLYWTKDTFGPKPVISGFHQTTYRRDGGALVATKLLAASHYYNAGLEMMAGVATGDGKTMYLVLLYRTRLDPPTGMLAGVLMGKIKDGAENGVKEKLKRTQRRLGEGR